MMSETKDIVNTFTYGIVTIKERKDLRNHKTSGIYCFRNKTNSKCYVGRLLGKRVQKIYL